MAKHTAVSLFCGSGGLDLGFIAAGFDILLSNDNNENACASYSKNIGDHVKCLDIRKLTDVPHADVLIGGPPCQGMSTANPHRAFDDERNWLFREYRRILVACNPKIFLMENVAGMTTMEDGKIFEIIKAEFESAGYKIHAKLLNSADYSTPQSRKRMIMVGVRNDISAEYSFPDPTSPIRLTAGDAFAQPIDPMDVNHKASKLSALNLERIKHIPMGGSMKDCPKELQNNSDLKRAMRRLDLRKPSYTIVHNNCDHYYHPTEDRRVTIREMARIQGYPDSYIFTGSKSEQSRQVGNSVPVPFATALAGSVKILLDSIDHQKSTL
jgi:DNA (cytosine-5)-methyltransferase 1